METVRKQLYISPRLDRLLRRISQRDDVSESEVMRRALERHFQDLGVDSEVDPILGTIGLAGCEGPGTGSTGHDDIYERQ